ncbi:MAG: leucyl/phenylalanyl-tRNA--protein transferase [Sphingomonas bacterium]|nr:leucyl/phenylalanyl-tRNA--protein transferase [Sphingomonas bacterium]
MSGLDPRILLRGYAAGIFPMADSRDAEEIFWVEPRSRAILPLRRFRLSRSLSRSVRRDTFSMTCDTAFAEVVRACADREETWINADIERATLGLHAAGQAHSIECWEGDGDSRVLVGGLYGVRLGRAFFGESMFSRRTDASKVALAWLIARLRFGHFLLLDCQFMTDHLASLGAVTVKRDLYVALLSGALGAGSAAAGASSGASFELFGELAPGELPPPDFGALDRLLDPPAERGGSAAPGQLITQLLTQTS